MKDIETTWSHIVARKLSHIRTERGMSQQELADKVGVTQNFISSTLGRQKKGSEDFFTKVGVNLGLPKKEIDAILQSSIYEAIEQEFPNAGLGFALKSRFGLSEQGLKDVLHFISDIQKKEAKNRQN